MNHSYHFFNKDFLVHGKKTLSDICKESGGTFLRSRALNSDRTLTSDCAVNEKHTRATDGPPNSNSTWRSRHRSNVSGTKTNDDRSTSHVHNAPKGNCALTNDSMSNENRRVASDFLLNSNKTCQVRFKQNLQNSTRTPLVSLSPNEYRTITNDDVPTSPVRNTPNSDCELTSNCSLNDDHPNNSSGTHRTITNADTSTVPVPKPLVILSPMKNRTITNDDVPTSPVSNAPNSDCELTSNCSSDDDCQKNSSCTHRTITNDNTPTVPVRDLPDNINTLTSNHALNKNRALTTDRSSNSNVILNSTSNQLSDTPYKLSKIYRRLKMLNSKPIMSSFIYDSDNETCQLDTTLFNRPSPLTTPMQNYAKSSTLPPTRPESNTNMTTSQDKRVNSHVRYKLDEHDCTLIHPIDSSPTDNVEQIQTSTEDQSNNSNDPNNKSNTNRRKQNRRKENHLKTNAFNNKECIPPATRSRDPLSKNSEPLQFKGGKNSFKRRKQLRDILMMKEMNNGDDFLTSTPFRNDNQAKHVEHFEADLVTTPCSYLACTPGVSMLNTTEEPTIQASLNKNKLERYTHKLELNRKKNRQLPKETSKQTKTSEKLKVGFNWNAFSEKMQSPFQHPKPIKRSKINTDPFCDQPQAAYQSDDDEDDDYYFSD